MAQVRVMRKGQPTRLPREIVRVGHDERFYSALARLIRIRSRPLSIGPVIHPSGPERTRSQAHENGPVKQLVGEACQ
jgi:hypothetical protein